MIHHQQLFISSLMLKKHHDLILLNRVRFLYPTFFLIENHPLVLTDIQPSMIICSAKTSDEYYKALNEHLNIQTGVIDVNNISTNPKLQLVPQAYFRKCRDLIC